ncbi:hypothetical protein FIBSPDRAFT_240981 [Athelia psychrophila]|uniref:Uncharacterized protein n=1 Tax=Athelia psychrophila TaxID=1759441 RepID=A0A165YAE1_9AGAM|nr:hypothetical protein FIBSPDRAFT_240981 [Fibularhizoctonia sp. CBS 109695]
MAECFYITTVVRCSNQLDPNSRSHPHLRLRRRQPAAHAHSPAPASQLRAAPTPAPFSPAPPPPAHLRQLQQAAQQSRAPHLLPHRRRKKDASRRCKWVSLAAPGYDHSVDACRDVPCRGVVLARGGHGEGLPSAQQLLVPRHKT